MTRPALRLAGYQPETSVHSRALHHVAALAAEAKFGGFAPQVVVDVTAHGHRAGELFAMVEDGRLDGCYVASSYLAARVPSLSVFDLPFVATDRARDYAKLDGAFGIRLAADIAARTPFRALGYWDNGFRHVSNRLKPIRTPDDCRGMTIRTLDNTLHQNVFAALGFTPMFVDVRDLAEAVAAHRVDAQENPLTNFVNFALFSTHRHVSLTAHFFGIALFLVNERWFSALPDELRIGLHGAIVEATARQRQMAAGEDARCLDILERDGVAVVGTDEIDWAAFRAAVAGVVDHEVARLSGSG
jgi:TRAP-type C4-dicarboxylate transport system substrate-binding protein